MVDKEELLNILDVEQRLEDLEKKYSLIKNILDSIYRLEKRVNTLEFKVIDLDPRISDKL